MKAVCRRLEQVPRGAKGIRFAHSFPGTASPAPNSSIRTFFGVAKATACPQASAKVRTLAKVLDLRLGGHMDGAWARCVYRRVAVLIGARTLQDAPVVSVLDGPLPVARTVRFDVT